MAIGVLVGAPSAGSAEPHLLRIVGSPGWQAVVWTASAYSALTALICLLFVKDGPHLARGARFDWRYAGRAFTDRFPSGEFRIPWSHTGALRRLDVCPSVSASELHPLGDGID